MVTEHLSLMPLAARMRPQALDQFIGQSHLLGVGKGLRYALSHGKLHSMILWGPPGTGKTTLARLMAQHTSLRFEACSALSMGVRELRLLAETAKVAYEKVERPQPTLLFIDEIHRFTQSQQDVLLPFVELGLFILVGATTENPSFALNNALLSRTRVYVLKKLAATDIVQLIDRALGDTEHGLGKAVLTITEGAKQQLANIADGDARQALNLLEIAADLAEHQLIDESILKEVTQTNLRRFDKHADFFHEQISALHKSVRGSHPDAALYWLAGMLDGGCDPLYLARRIVRMASEDIGNADPRAVQLALTAWQVQERLGSPEGELTLAQAVVYLACTAKSNAVYNAFNAAKAEVAKGGTLDVPPHLRNATTRLMRQLDYGKDYRYPHDEPNAYAQGVTYFPEALGEQEYYFPVPRGLELKIGEKLKKLRESTPSQPIRDK